MLGVCTAFFTDDFLVFTVYFGPVESISLPGPYRLLVLADGTFCVDEHVLKLACQLPIQR